MIRIIQALHDGTNGVVRFEGQVSSEFSIEYGVKQGDVDSFTVQSFFEYSNKNRLIKSSSNWFPYAI